MTKNVMIAESLGSSQFDKVKTPDIVIPEGMMLVEGVVGAVDITNRNGRFYSREEYARHVEDFNQRSEKLNGILGEMEHPQTMNIDLNNVSHKMISLRIDEDNMVRGKILLLDTPKGLIAQSIVRSGAPLPISSRATGVVEKNGNTKLNRLETYDLVGTAGFEQTALYETKFTNESLEGVSNGLVTESFVFNLDNSGRIVHDGVKNENLQTENINENMTQYLTIDEAKELFKSMIAEEKSVLTLEKVDERFETLYANAIESWVKETYTPHLMTNVQEWLFESFAPVVQNWITEEVLPKNAEITEKWLTEEVLPKNAEVTEKWINESFAKVIQDWITEEVLPHNAEVTETWIKESFAIKFGEILESHIDETMEEIKANIEPSKPAKDALEVDEEKPLEQPVAEHLKFKSEIMDRLDGKIAESLSIEKPVVVENLDNSEFAFAQPWLRLIPESHKDRWRALTNEQKQKVYSRASVRVIESLTDVETFWNSLNYEALRSTNLNENQTIKRDIQISENVNKNSFASSIVGYAKNLKN